MKINRILLVVFMASPTQARAVWKGYVPESRAFSCSVPQSWEAVESGGNSVVSVHLLGPEDPLGLYRTGIDIRRFEKGQADYQGVEKALALWRRSDKENDRSITAVRPMRVSGSLSMTFEVSEKRWLPIEELPLSQQYVHHYVAIIPQGEDYYVATLSSLRSVYLDYRNVFYGFLKSFKTL